MPQSLNYIFGRNLRALCDERGSYAETARLLETNRVQLNRFFNGESFPKPNQLVRICQMFGVDSRIFTVPLDELRAEQALSRSTYRQKILKTLERYSKIPTELPDGIHVMYRDNPVMPGNFSMNLLLVRRQDGIVWLRGLTPPPPGVSRRQSGLFSLRSWEGHVAGLTGGFAFQTYGMGNLSFFLPSYFTLKNRPTPSSFAGLFDVFLPQLGGSVSQNAIVLEILEQEPAKILSVARQCGRIRFSDLPDAYRDHFTSFPATKLPPQIG